MMTDHETILAELTGLARAFLEAWDAFKRAEAELKSRQLPLAEALARIPDARDRREGWQFVVVDGRIIKWTPDAEMMPAGWKFEVRDPLIK